MPFPLITEAALGAVKNLISTPPASGSLAFAPTLVVKTVKSCTAGGQRTDKFSTREGQNFVDESDPELGLALCDKFGDTTAGQ